MQELASLNAILILTQDIENKTSISRFSEEATN
jgi:hypothetical protein